MRSAFALHLGVSQLAFLLVDAQVGSLLHPFYQELRKLANAKMRRERGSHTLQATALVHEAYLRLADQPESIWKDRPRILALAAHAMRHILVDHARARAAGKRGAGAIQVTLDEGLAAAGGTDVDVLAVDQALTQVVDLLPQVRILELHFFAGMTFDEIAAELGISARTIKRDYDGARVAACHPGRGAYRFDTSLGRLLEMHVENVTTLAIGDDVSQLTTQRDLQIVATP